MSKKIPLAVAIALIFVFSALTVIITVSVYLRTYTKSLQSFGEQAKQFATLTEIEALIRSNFNGSIDAASESVSTAKGYVDGLGDKNAAYLTSEEYAAYLSDYAGMANGVGLETRFDSISVSLAVTSVKEDSPAAAVGISVDDRIVSVGREEVTVTNYSRLQEKLSAYSEQSLSVSIIKQSDEEGAVPETFTLSTRYQTASVKGALSGRIGYIRISAFFDDTADRFSSVLSEMTAQGITKLLLDLRNNRSVNYDIAAAVLDQLVPMATEGTGALASAKRADGSVVKAYASDTRSIAMPVAVLVNDRTEGAAELVAADLRDFLNAKIIGERTAGNAGYPDTFLLEDGSALILTVAKIYPYITDCYDDTGIIPDVEIVLPDFQKDMLNTLSKEEDAQYQAAVSALS